MNILVLNAGSSSLKFRLFQMERLCPLLEPEQVLAGGHIERIGDPGAILTLFRGEQEAEHQSFAGSTSVSEAVQEIIRQITRPSPTVPQPIAIDAVGHRIVHGGAQFSEPLHIDEAALRELRDLTELAPLHNPSGIAGVEAARKALPHAENVAVFDTAFHHDLPRVAAAYALPIAITERLKLRRYGFHGISYRFVAERLRLTLENGPQRRFSATRLIVCHLGNGASVCAIHDGKSVDTSMGFTPLEGLIMGTRCGDVDPGLLLHLLRRTEMTVEQLEDLLNHESGLLGLSGRSGDSRDLEKAAGDGDLASQLALECFGYRVRKYIGAYAAALGGVDILAFTAGIGENSASMRARICHGLGFLGLYVDDERNQNANGREPVDIGVGDDGRVWIVPTDEERQIARETFVTLTQR